MRHVLYFGLVGTAAILPFAASAQATTPDQIICAMSGSCAGNVANSAQQITVTDEKSFSLVKTSAQPQQRSAAPAIAPTAKARPTATRVAAYSSAPRVRAASGRIEMLVSFDLGSADLTDQAKGEARSFASAASSPALAGMHFNVEGHTDAKGSREYNLDLSQRRAQAVVDYLVTQGVPASQLTARGYGFDKPRSGMASTAAGNRRVEFVKAG